jgi:O-antigen ligase
MLASVIGAAWLLLNHRKRAQAAIIAAVLCVVVLTLAGNEIRDRFLSTSNYENDHSANARFESWSAAWQIATDHPLFGQGIRNSNTFTENYGADRQGRTIHSQYLQIAADSGIPAMAVYGSMMLGALLYTGRARSLCRQAARELPEGADDARRVEIENVAMLALGIQASLLSFAFGAIFLSLEVFELPWLLIMVAGLLPMCVRRWLDDLPAAPAAAQPVLKPAHAAALAMLARRATPQS